MKNREIIHARQEVKIYSAYYKPSLNPWRFMKSILGLLLFGTTTAASQATYRKRMIK